MKALVDALKEVKHFLVAISIVDSVIESLVVFLIFLLFLTQFNQRWYFAIPPAFIYYVYRTIRLISKRDLLLVENKVPVLSEKLRTAADYLGKSNEIIESLNKDVLGLMRQIKTSYFISFKGIIQKVAMLFILSMLIIFVSSLNVKLADLKGLLDPLFDDTGARYVDFDNESGLIKDGDIYGDEEIVELGKERLDLKVNLVASDVNIDEFKETEKKDFITTFPEDVGAVADTSFEEDFSKEYKEVVKNYFEKINEKNR